MDVQWTQWHADHERRLADPHGFLAITSLNFLTDEPQRFPDAPGSWSTGPHGVVVDLADGETLTVDGTPVTGRYAFGRIPERDGINARSGDAVIEVARRGGFDIVRPRHPDNPLRLEFRGVPAYEPNAEWVLHGRYVPFDTPRQVSVGAAGASTGAAADPLEVEEAAPDQALAPMHGGESTVGDRAGTD